MSMLNLPHAARPFVEFPQVLRKHGFVVSPDQIISFLEAIEVLGPQDITQIRNAGLAIFAISKERRMEYDALFRAYFMGQTLAAPTQSDEDGDEADAIEELDGSIDIDVEEDEEQPGELASAGEKLSVRDIKLISDEDALAKFSKKVWASWPRRKSLRHISTRNGTQFDMRRSLREAVKRDGEIFNLRETKQKLRQRPIVLLIDISGSMSARLDESLQFAHALKQAGDKVEVFTFGTRLTRVTKSLAEKSRERALDRVSRLVADIDGGTRIGEALDALLSVPRFKGLMRGAVVIVLSDGLERGSPELMVDCLHRMSRLSWRLEWLTPLASEPNFTPQTEALVQSSRYINNISNGGSIASICEHFLTLGRVA